MIDDLSLEEVLEKGLSEADQLFKKGNPLLANYTLFLVAKKYENEEAAVPAEVEQLRQDIKENIKQTYPAKIEKEIKEGDLRKAMGSFLSLSVSYTRDVPPTNPAIPHIPGEFYYLVGLIEEKAQDADEELKNEAERFIKVYPKRRFIGVE